MNITTTGLKQRKIEIKVFNNKKTDSTWYVSLDYNFLETWEKVEEEE